VAIDDQVSVRNSPIIIKRLTLDLGGSVDDLQEATNTLSSRVRSWAEE
jgi:hypothetical protein